MSTNEFVSAALGTQPRQRVARGRWAPLPVLLAGTFMVVLDFSIVNVALPSIQSGLHAGDGTLEWVIAGYALTSAVFLIPAGRLGDRFGRRQTFSAGLTMFTLASAACGIASTPGQLVMARLAQGVGAALMTQTCCRSSASSTRGRSAPAPSASTRRSWALPPSAGS